VDDPELLVMRLNNPDPQVRWAAAKALHGTTTDPSAQMCLIGKLDRSDADLRQAAAHALQGGTITDGSVALILIGKLDRSDSDIRRAAAQALTDTTITDAFAQSILQHKLDDLTRNPELPT
jgi:HEAT repeat protein